MERKPFYRKIIVGVVEQVYDSEGYCISQDFIPLESEPVDRRMIREDGEHVDGGELEDDELIEHPDDLRYVEGLEKHQDTEMVQPPLRQ